MLISSVILLYAPASQKYAQNFCQTALKKPPPLQPQTSLLPLSGSLPHTPLLSAFLSLLVALKNLLK